MSNSDEWQPAATMPAGVRVEVKREDCPGYDTTAIGENGKLSLASFFIRGDMTMHSVPTHWRHVAPR